MRVVIQRVNRASVAVKGRITAAIDGQGLLILLGIEDADNQSDVDWLVKKILQLRIFNDADGVMNLSVQDVGGNVIVVSQFTLHAVVKKGNRPSYIRAAHPETAIPLYESFVETLQEILGKSVGTGIFGEQMDVSLVNDGPVTIIVDTKNKDF
ncbi:MAG: D-aminoacyl-tRNA deacylase [Prolixibacteraceae bacterium]|nr:D-aminoacyl-tRNA deacylase [Prolixibacteraceae bacterium]